VLLERRRLGASELEVSELALGSWRTFERIPREAGIAVMSAARESGINFLDDARYNDETGLAPLSSGYSEVVFGELFRAAGWRRDEVVLANKLWWEFWPGQGAEAELDGSLTRMGMDHLDLVYAERPPSGYPVEEVVQDIAGLIRAGKVRAWGVLNWPASLVIEAARAAARSGLPAPCAAQLPYSLVQRSPVEDPDMVEALGVAGASIVASYTLAGGALSGKYGRPRAAGRITDELDQRDYSSALHAGAELSALAGREGVDASAMAIAFTLLNPRVAAALFGATGPKQVMENLKAVEVRRSMREPAIRALRQIGG